MKKLMIVLGLVAFFCLGGVRQHAKAQSYLGSTLDVPKTYVIEVYIQKDGKPYGGVNVMIRDILMDLIVASGNTDADGKMRYEPLERDRMNDFEVRTFDPIDRKEPLHGIAAGYGVNYTAFNYTDE